MKKPVMGLGYWIELEFVFFKLYLPRFVFINYLLFISFHVILSQFCNSDSICEKDNSFRPCRGLFAQCFQLYDP